MREDLLRERVEQAAIEAQKVEERVNDSWTARLANAVASALTQAENEHKNALSTLQAQHEENLTEQLQGKYNQGVEETSTKYFEKIKELEEGYQVALVEAERQKRVDAEVVEGLEQVHSVVQLIDTSFHYLLFIHLLSQLVEPLSYQMCYSPTTSYRHNPYSNLTTFHITNE